MYADNPVRYVRDILGVQYLTPDQIKVLQAVTNPHARILVPSGNETGKSFLAACIASWHYDCFHPSLTLITAPSKAQVTDIVFRELRRVRRWDTNFSPKADNLEESKNRMCKGYTSKDGTSFHGRHDAHVLLIFDEAEGIDGTFWEAAESFANRWICFYNPTTSNSQAAVEERKRTWTTIRMSAFNHPNIKAAEIGLPPPIPNAVTMPKLLNRLSKWATRVEEPSDPRDVTVQGVTYRMGPIAEARLAGTRPLRPTNAVFDEITIANTLNPRPTFPGAPTILAIDVARFGDDMSTFHVRRGPTSIYHTAYNGLDIVQLADQVDQTAARIGPFKSVVIDSIGVGGGLVDILKHKGYNVIPVNSSCQSDKPDEFPNLRSQLYFDFQDLAAEGYVDLSGIHEDFTHDIHEQLRAASYTLDGRGRRVVEDKYRMKATLGRSPDDADAVLLCYYQFPETYENNG